MFRITKRFGVVARDCPFEQLSQYIDKEERVSLMDGTPAVVCFDGELAIIKVFKGTVDTINVEGEVVKGRWDTVNLRGHIFVTPLTKDVRHVLVIDGHNYDMVLELDAKAEEVPDNPIAQAKARLHKQRETGPVQKGSEEEETSLRKSELAAVLREGAVRNDDPEILNALLRFHAAEVAARRKLLLNFFDSWSLDDLQLLLRVTCTHMDPADEQSSHSFVKRATAWRGIANSQGASLWRDSLNSTILKKEQGPGEVDLQLKWYLLMKEYEETILH